MGRDDAQHRVGGGAQRVLGRLVGGVHRRHPNDACAAACGDLNRDWVEAADRVVQYDRAKCAHLGGSGAHHRSALGRRHIVRLQDEAGQAELLEPSRQIQVGDPARNYIRLDRKTWLSLMWIRSHGSIAAPKHLGDHRIQRQRLACGPGSGECFTAYLRAGNRERVASCAARILSTSVCVQHTYHTVYGSCMAWVWSIVSLSLPVETGFMV